MKKVYVQLKNELSIDCDIQKAIDGFSYMGYEPVGYGIVDIITGKINHHANTCPFIGSISALTYLFKNIDKYPEPIDFPADILQSGLLHRKIEITTLYKAKEMFLQNQQPIFIKPIETGKFGGVKLQNKSQMSYFSNYHDSTKVYVSEILDIVSEHRVFIHHNEIVYCCSYSGDFTINPDFSYINSIISCYKQPVVAYTIDVATLSSGNTTLVEINDFWAIGSYGLNSITYAQMLLDRYTEIIL